jgi:hypothetical protein
MRKVPPGREIAGRVSDGCALELGTAGALVPWEARCAVGVQHALLVDSVMVVYPSLPPVLRKFFIRLKIGPDLGF